MLQKTLLSLASPAGPRSRLSTLVFHRVLAEVDPLFPDEMHASRFDTVCRWLSSWFNALPLDEAVRRLAAGTLPARALAITFDDGYADNWQIAIPILKRHGLPATFFIATGFLDGGLMWNDRVIESVRLSTLPAIDLRDLLGDEVGLLALQTPADRRIAIDAILRLLKYLDPDQREQRTHQIADRLGVNPPCDMMLRSTQVQQIRKAGMQIGAHTVSHPILAGLGKEAVRREMAGSKQRLEGLLQEPVTMFAYPNGKPVQDFTDDTVDAAREIGFDAATSTAWGVADRSTDVFRIPRFTPWDRSRLRFGARMLSNLLSAKSGRSDKL